jgi:hypothetical protein
MLAPKLVDFDDEIKPLGTSLVSATIALYQSVERTFLPTPASCHYLFNMRDMAKVIQGLLISDKQFISGREGMLRLWLHECLRVFSDRLTSSYDRRLFKVRKTPQDTHVFIKHSDLPTAGGFSWWHFHLEIYIHDVRKVVPRPHRVATIGRPFRSETFDSDIDFIYIYR